MDPADARPDDVAVLIPAAGKGRRLGGRPKQFRTLGEHPVLVQVLLSFERHPAVGHAVVAAPEDRVAEVTDRLEAEGLSVLTAVVRGGENRQASVRHALRAVPDPVDTVLVHDAARPFVAAAQVQAVVQASRADGAASLAVPVADTLRRGGDDQFGDTIPRSDLYRMQTPQGFRRGWLEQAHRRASSADGTATDDVALVQRLDREVVPVSGSRRNFKITTPDDWALARELWPGWKDAPERFGEGAST
ncbi:2-C-methyl-D-erythritol 4-phosphate cytidylyltransferase [Salinibacter altiplanensis]|uniref:2-C-methyl-D-erythritol 4-phosphate cytidylyltransferase n=1 Tax=Salinibacter altiplanensis TaxID=1803181 RepID=UPI000C9F2DEE|nr:2-C-methyl-D-erythritol 4-phosphate cytidylyltransferase [Salinibacter altiplanensis]